MAPTVATVGATTATTAPAVIGHSATTRPDSSHQPSDNGGNVTTMTSTARMPSRAQVFNGVDSSSPVVAMGEGGKLVA